MIQSETRPSAVSVPACHTVLNVGRAIPRANTSQASADGIVSNVLSGSVRKVHFESWDLVWTINPTLLVGRISDVGPMCRHCGKLIRDGEPEGDAHVECHDKALRQRARG